MLVIQAPARTSFAPAGCTSGAAHQLYIGALPDKGREDPTEVVFSDGIQDRELEPEWRLPRPVRLASVAQRPDLLG